MQGLVIGGCTRRTTYLRNFVFFPKPLQAWPRNSIHWTIHTISLKLRSCFLSEGSLPVQVLFHALTGKRIMLIYLWDADDDSMQSLKSEWNCLHPKSVRASRQNSLRHYCRTTNKQKLFSISYLNHFFFVKFPTIFIVYYKTGCLYASWYIIQA